MKIRNDQLHALQQQGETRVKPKSGEGFDALLTEELGAAPGLEGVAPQTVQGTSTSAVLSATLAGVASQLAVVEDAGESMSLGGVAQRIDGLFTNLDAYAASLNSPGGADLRKAYGLLQGMDKDIKDIHAKVPDLATRHSGLAALVNEIEVTAAAEGFKMNRGDYL